MSSRHVSSPHVRIGNPGMCTNCSTRDVLGERAVMEGDGGTSHVGHGVDEFKEREIGREEEKRLFNSCLGSCSFSCLRNRLYIPSSPLYISIGSLRWRTSPTHIGVGTRHEAALRAGQQTFARDMLRLDAENYNYLKATCSCTVRTVVEEDMVLVNHSHRSDGGVGLRLWAAELDTI